MKDDSPSSADHRPVRVFRLGEEPRDDLRGTTTPEQRLEMLRELSERAWKLTGRPFPDYERERIPVKVTIRE